MKRGIKVVELQDAVDMEKITFIISEIKNISDWKEILGVVPEKKEEELKILIEVKTNFTVDEELKLENYVDSFIRVASLEEALDIVNMIKANLTDKGPIKMEINDLKYVGFKKEERYFI